MCETGWFASLWREMAERLNLRPEFLQGDWRRAAEPADIEAYLRADKAHEIKAVAVVHNETSTGCTSRVAEVRKALDAAGHPALLLVDTISSLGSMEYKHDEWGVDVTVAGSQKGLMLPPGLSFNAVGPKALKASETAKLTRSFWDWKPMIASNATGFFPYTPATNMLYALDTALDMLFEEGMENVFARHDRMAEATRRAVRAWGLEIQCDEPRHYSSVLTAVRMPEGHSANGLRSTILEKFNMSLGNGLGQLNDKVFRIGHLGDVSELHLVGTLSGVEMGLRAAGIPHKADGVKAAMDYIAGNA
ncbi:MAG: Serine-pyruvate aminotransferase/archaeal aspartate aminotransferase, partial [Rubritepida sp.]|nr:Serine-pyruvate aminotransferase/archaeal aspartate aminotransferase [Rubritepida sp.]